MKFVVTALLLICSFALYGAESAAVRPYTSDQFVKLVKEGVLESDDTLIMKNLTMLLAREREIGHPNCFSCSLFLIRESGKTTPEKRLLLADYAVRFSPDLPDAWRHRLIETFDINPFDFTSHYKSLKGLAYAVWASPGRDAFFGGLGAFLHLFTMLFATLLFVILFSKYWSPSAHMLAHMTGFSVFWRLAAALVAGGMGFYLYAAGKGLYPFFLLLLFFFYRMLRYREFALLLAALIGLLTSESISIAVQANNAETAAEHYTEISAIYSPDGLSHGDIHSKGLYADLAKGFLMYYDRNCERSLYYFSEVRKHNLDNALLAAVLNMEGVCYRHTGNALEAKRRFTDAYRTDPKGAYSFNLNTMLYELGETQEASQLEVNVLSRFTSEKFEYPAIKLPVMSTMYHNASAGKGPSNLFKVMVYWSGVVFTFLLMLGLYFGYMGRFRVARCIECGSVICESCQGDDDTEICAPCRLIKSGKGILHPDDSARHQKTRDRWARIRMIHSSIFSVFIPGGGLIFNNRIMEGSFYLGVTVFAITYIYSGTVIHQLLPQREGIGFLLFSGIAVLMWLISLIRTFTTFRSY